jgi:hypothetical protein
MQLEGRRVVPNSLLTARTILCATASTATQVLVLLSVPIIIGETAIFGPYWREFGPSICSLSAPNPQ